MTDKTTQELLSELESISSFALNLSAEFKEADLEVSKKLYHDTLSEISDMALRAIERAKPSVEAA